MMRKNYFENCILGESYTYGLKCTSPAYVDDVREVVEVAAYTHKNIVIKIDTHCRRMYKIILSEGAEVDITCVIVARKDVVTDAYVEILHHGNVSHSRLTMRGYTEGNGRIICRFVTEVPRDSEGCVAVQKALFYEFGSPGGIDCIPELSVANKHVQSSHSIACERITEEETWFAAMRGLNELEYTKVIQQNISMLV